MLIDIEFFFVHTADNRACLPPGLLVYFWCAIKLWEAAGLSKAAAEVSLLRIREGVLVGLDEVFEGLGGSEHLAVGFPGLEAFVCGGVQEVVL